MEPKPDHFPLLGSLCKKNETGHPLRANGAKWCVMFGVSVQPLLSWVPLPLSCPCHRPGTRSAGHCSNNLLHLRAENPVAAQGEGSAANSGTSLKLGQGLWFSLDLESVFINQSYASGSRILREWPLYYLFHKKTAGNFALFSHGYI